MYQKTYESETSLGHVYFNRKPMIEIIIFKLIIFWKCESFIYFISEQFH